jgi:hypothetical protein
LRPPQRIPLIVLLVALVALLAACWMNHEEVKLTFDNRTEWLLCFELSQEDASDGRCLQEVEPLKETAWTPGCGYGEDADEAPLTVVLTVKEDGRQLYQGTRECRAWQATNRRFVIEERDGDLVVISPLADATETP